MQSLEQTGIELYAIQGKGTRLAEPLDLLNETLILGGLSKSARSELGHLILLDETPSTNQHLMTARLHGLPNGTACLAEMQTQGKGRLGRTWISPFGRNIYLSVLWRFEGNLSSLSGLSLACGVMACRALQQLGVQGVGLKWPNDLLWQGRKLGGILVEVQGETEGSFCVVIGIGLNVDMGKDEHGLIDQPWVDLVTILAQARGQRNQLTAALLNQLLPMLAQYQDTGLAPYLDEWNQLDCLKNQAVRLLRGANEQLGVARGIGDNGELLLQDDMGQIHRINGGEVSMRAVG